MVAKTKVDTFLTFMKKVTFNNTLNDILLDFQADGIHVTAMSSNNILFSDALLKKSAFSNYESLGKVGIPNCTKLVNLLKQKKGDISLTKSSDGKLCYSLETSAASIPLCDEKFVGSHVEEKPPFLAKMDSGFNLTTAEFKKILNDWNTLGTDKAELVHTGTNFTIKIADDTGYEVSETFNCKYKPQKTAFGLLLKDIMKVINGNVNLSFSFTENGVDNLPLRVREEREHYSIDLIIAPLDPNSEAHKKAQEEAKERQDRQEAAEREDADATDKAIEDSIGDTEA